MKKILLLFMSLFSLTYMYAEENVWVLQTDTQVNVPIDEVDYLLAADDDNLFAVVMKSGEMYDGVKKVVFSQTSYISNTPQPTDVRLLSRSVRGQLSLTGLVPGATVQVYAVDGTEITSFETLSSIVTSHSVGDKLKFTVIRDGNKKDITLELEEKSAETQSS